MLHKVALLFHAKKHIFYNNFFVINLWPSVIIGQVIEEKGFREDSEAWILWEISWSGLIEKALDASLWSLLKLLVEDAYL